MCVCVSVIICKTGFVNQFKKTYLSRFPSSGRLTHGKMRKKQPSSTQQIQESFGEQGEDHTQSWPVAWGSLQASSKLLTKGQGLEVAGQIHSPQTLGR
jgi:hypothetical protein